MRALVLSDGETVTTLAGCRVVEIDDALAGADVDAAVKQGNYTELHRFNGTEGGVTLTAAFSRTELARLRELLIEYAGLNERTATLAQATAAQRDVHARDAELLRRQAKRYEHKSSGARVR